jgi:O-antigen ligase
MPWSPAVIFAIGVGALTAIGIAVTFQRFDQDFAEHAARSWLGSVGGAMIVLVVAVWVARNGSRRAFVAAIIAATAAGGLSLLDHTTGIVSNGPLAWVGFWKDFNGRLAGVVPSPNGMAALMIIPTAVLLFWAILGRGRLVWRLAGLVVAAMLVVALYLTYSRAALLGLFIIGAVGAWRIRRMLGVAVVAAGIVGGIVLLPGYLQLRSESALEGTVTPGSILVASDALRFRAWDTAVKMWQDEPLTGQGFLAYRDLGPAFGDPVLGSPHNEWLRLFAEEGTLTGLFGLVFLVTTLIWLARPRDPVGGGLLAGTAGYFLMASFNNPFLFIQISIVAFTAIGFGLAEAVRRRGSGEAAQMAEAADATPATASPELGSDAAEAPGEPAEPPATPGTALVISRGDRSARTPPTRTDARRRSGVPGGR